MRRRCPKCGAEWEGAQHIGFHDECPECAAYLHTCAQCRHFRADIERCAIPNTEQVHDRYASNYCEDFEFVGAPEPPTDRPTPRSKDNEKEARKRFDDLFRNPDA